MNRAPRILPPLTVGIAAALVLLPTLRYDFTALDDDDLILDRQPFLTGPSATVRAFSTPYFGTGSRSYYRPAVTLSFMADAHVFGTSPAGYHRTNLLLHALCSVLLYLLLRRLRIPVVPALTGTLLFAVHPVHAAAGAWIPGRTDLLLTLFALGAALALPLSAAAFAPRAALHLLLFAGALLSKETAFVLPLLFIGLRIAAGLPPTPRLIGAWIALLAAMLLIRAWVLETPSGLYLDAALTVVRRLPVLLSDLGKVLFPVRLQVLASPKDLHVLPGIAAAILLGALVYYLSDLRSRRTALAAALFVLPALIGLAGAERVILENRLYLPSAGIALFAAELLALAAAHPLGRKISIAASCVVIALFIVQHTLQIAPYKNPDTFAARAIRDAPNSGVAVNLLRRRSFDHAPFFPKKTMTHPPPQ